MKPFINFLLLILPIFIISCNPQESKIKKDLNTRWTKFDIVEIKKDSANVYEAINRFRSLGIQVFEVNGKIIDAKIRTENETNKDTLYKYYNYADSLHKNMERQLVNFDNTKNNKNDQCYYVKYLIYKDESKIPKEEYYYIKQSNGDIMHRPCDWNEFLKEREIDKVMQELNRYFEDLLIMKSKVINYKSKT